MNFPPAADRHGTLPVRGAQEAALPRGAARGGQRGHDASLPGVSEWTNRE